MIAGPVGTSKSVTRPVRADRNLRATVAISTDGSWSYWVDPDQEKVASPCSDAAAKIIWQLIVDELDTHHAGRLAWRTQAEEGIFKTCAAKRSARQPDNIAHGSPQEGVVERNAHQWLIGTTQQFILQLGRFCAPIQTGQRRRGPRPLLVAILACRPSLPL